MTSKACLLLAFSLVLTTTTCLGLARQQQNKCQLQNLQALDPNDVVQAEAGSTEFWDANNQQFQCAGVDFIRHRIQPGGLLLPSYVTTPILLFIENGQGSLGVILPGCPETFEYSPKQQQFDHKESFQFQDRHQKVEIINEGDVVAIPTGAAHWLHNHGNTELVVVVFFDTQNIDNQLDERRRRFYLAGNPQAQSKQNSRNIFNGWAAKLIAELFNVDAEIAQKLRGESDQRGHIVNAGQDLQIIGSPQLHQGQGQGGGRSNGFEETICGLKLKENINNPSLADFVNPQAGRITNLNSFKFPLLKQLQLSVERGELRPNAIQSPHWTVNAHNLIYITQGTLRVQIVDNQGNSVFDDELKKGQVLVIPQNFAVIKRAGEQGSKWVSFKTNDNAVIANLAGRVSVIRSLPLDVLATSYQLPRDKAQRLKYSQRQTALFAPTSFKGPERAFA